VKGQLPDRSGGERAPQEGFLNLIDLIRPGTVTIGVATHDIELAKQSLARLTERGIPTELEQLYRLRPISGDSYPAVPRRLYVPYGYGYPPYDLYAALRRPRQALRLATDVLCGMCIRSSSLVRSAGDSPTEGIRHCP
jgi:proline dehydrogenase